MKTQFEEVLRSSQSLHVQQVLEGFEIVLGFESRNKYRIFDEHMNPVAFAAETSTGFLGTLTRLFFKHWRTFSMNIYSPERELMYKVHFPFRWFFKHMSMSDVQGRELGHLEQRFAILYKKFDLYDAHNNLISQIRSPFFKLWTFEFKNNNRKVGTIQKKWSGALTEIFTDKDNFIVSYAQQDLPVETRALMMATCLMVDIVYFENNQGSGGLANLVD